MSEPRVYQVRARDIFVLIIGLAMVAMLLPRAVAAATGDAVNITDPSSSSRKAKVTSAGRLVSTTCDSDSCASITDGKLRVWDGSGDLTVNGSVKSLPTVVTGSTRVQKFVQFTSTEERDLVQELIPETSKLVVTSFTVANRSSSEVEVSLRSSHADPDDNNDTVEGDYSCNPAGDLDRLGGTEETQVNVQAEDSVHLSFPQPLLLPSGEAATAPWCVTSINAGPGTTVDVTIVGYFV